MSSVKLQKTAIVFVLIRKLETNMNYSIPLSGYVPINIDIKKKGKWFRISHSVQNRVPFDVMKLRCFPVSGCNSYCF